VTAQAARKHLPANNRQLECELLQPDVPFKMR
jgi:hypothetical protein